MKKDIIGEGLEFDLSDGAVALVPTEPGDAKNDAGVSDPGAE